MTPQEKAKELVSKFYPQVQWKLGQEDCLSRAKQCALISVDETLTFIDKQMQGWLDTDWINYWNQVKLEIENYGKKSI